MFNTFIPRALASTHSVSTPRRLGGSRRLGAMPLGSPAPAFALLLALATVSMGAKARYIPREAQRAPSLAAYPSNADDSPACKAARLTDGSVYGERAAATSALLARRIPRVMIPVRLLGPLSGVTYRPDFP